MLMQLDIERLFFSRMLLIASLLLHSSHTICQTSTSNSATSPVTAIVKSAVLPQIDSAFDTTYIGTITVGLQVDKSDKVKIVSVASKPQSDEYEKLARDVLSTWEITAGKLDCIKQVSVLTVDFVIQRQSSSRSVTVNYEKTSSTDEDSYYVRRKSLTEALQRRYPRMAIRNKVSATVVLKASIERETLMLHEARVMSVTPTSSFDEEFSVAALSAIKEAQFGLMPNNTATKKIIDGCISIDFRIW